ncbi:MAG TPA: carbohydrate binding domain-containing protein, partial [Thermodesulfobacteriota bacterium]|nr:carbohydrate binding domain-containing protein [Thermodesulfobacteriota bacterium]
MKRIFFCSLSLIVSLVAGYSIIGIWRGVSLYQRSLSEENLLRATRLAPSNSDPYYRLGLFYQWQLRHIDLKESAYYLGKAIELNPLEQEYWLNLAKVYQRMGESTLLERALKNAISVFPTSYRGRWVSANLFLQQGDFEKALPHFSYVLAYYPNQCATVYDVLEKAVSDSDFILEKIVPKDSSSFRQYLSYLYETGDKDSARKAWAKRFSFGYQVDRGQTLRHIEFLISRGEFNEAFQVWNSRLQEEALPISEDSNLITNGGFEKEKILGGGFDWKIEKVPGAEVSFDPSVAFEGKRSLKIAFDGKENVDFYHVYQFVPLKSDTEYVLTANVKTQAVTTKSGLKIEVIGIGQAFQRQSQSLTGDNEWKELIVSFRTPAQLQGGLVRVRRD